MLRFEMAQRNRLFVIHGSHPCEAVKKAMDLKGMQYSLVEWAPPLQSPLQKLVFGVRTVPGIRFSTGEKVAGSIAIMHRLDELAPDPALYPADPELRRRVEAAELWGDDFQHRAREMIWPAMVNSPAAIVAYSEHSKLPLPAFALRASAPVIARIASRKNRTNDDVARRTLQDLPPMLDKVDGWIADGTIGVPGQVNAADLQLLSTVRLMMTLGDARPLIEGRPCADRALGLWPTVDGEMPVGSIVCLTSP
jgi:glutathione S-transferase